MKITYIPEDIDGKQVQGDEIVKYDVHFEKGQTRDIRDQDALKFLKCPFFHLAAKEGEAEVIKAPKKKAQKKSKKKETLDGAD